MRRTARFTLLLAATLAHASAATQERIGSWVLNSGDDQAGSTGCVMRLDRPLFAKAGITGDLEVQAQGKRLVPVLVLRGLSTEVLMAAAMAGRTQASLQFAGGKPEDLNCAVGTSGYLCAPDEAAGQRLAHDLAKSRSVTVRVAVLIGGMKPVSAPEFSVELVGSREALARLRVTGASQISDSLAATSHLPDGLMQTADKLLKAAGYPNGVAGLQALLAKYRGK